MNRSAISADGYSSSADNPVSASPRQVSFFNVLRGAVAILPEAGIALRGLTALITTKPEKKKSIGLLLEQHAALQPRHIAIRYQDITWSYRELNQKVNRMAHLLMAQGVRAGDSVGVMLENRPETLIAVLATVKLGAIAGMLNTSQRGEVLEHSINLIQPKVMLIGEEMLDHMATVERSLPMSLKAQLYYVADTGQRECPGHYLNLDDAITGMPDNNPTTTREVRMHQPCYYIFTSGTTGLPKASVMSHYRWFKSMAGMGLASMRLNKHDVLYVSLPLYHNNALTVSLAAVLGAGACIAISRKFSVSRFWDEIREHGATGFCYIGELCRYLLNTQPTDKDRRHNIRVIIGNGLRADIWMEFKQRFGIHHVNEFYGASECNLVFTNALNLDQTAGICPLSYNIVAYDIESDQPVRNDKGFMEPVKKGHSGLLITEVNDKQPFDGYTDEEASNKKLFRDVFKKGDCWFNTGDLVINQGYKHVAFADRLGDTFRWKGENVATTEVESILMEFPGVEHAVVYGVEIPHTDGRAGMAALTMKPGYQPDWSSLTRHLREKLPAYAVPVFIRLQPQEEITGTFKYRKVELKNDAYHLDKVAVPVMYLAAGQTDYEPLTDSLWQDIDAGRISF
ncbi:MAG: long-chain-acyl-CoA synthetase [Oceanospirillaceae bacterium]|nr:long-chain-acyl-CoA synthetase [Oceanospirillaceae bacterium]MBT13671.1 long-chain-acyl-CoA synthetase [Oceanospirillaceae bacterium]|tara:strand:- start:4900 stop:6774 length:1875 start_codon:yes stop_codon:yes gene_type:complete